MGVIKIIMVLWITLFILTKTCDKDNLTNVISEQDLEGPEQQERVDTNVFNENKIDDDDDDNEDGWGSENEDEVEEIPDCVPNFFEPVLYSCKCIGSGKTIEVHEIENLYCFPQPNKFKEQIEGKHKTISTPVQYGQNIVPEKELKSCAPNELLDSEDVCFCGTDTDKEKLKKAGSPGFVDLKHICVPFYQTYCYENECQKLSQLKEPTTYVEENSFNSDAKNKLIEYVMKENDDEKTALHFDFENGNKEIIELMLNVFGENKKKELLKIVMKNNFTALHSAAKKEKPEILKLLLNVFREDKNEKLFEYVMKEDENKNTILHIALENGKNKEIVELLLNSNIFSKTQHAKLMKYILKKNNKNLSALQIAQQYLQEKELSDYRMDFDYFPYHYSHLLQQQQLPQQDVDWIAQMTSLQVTYEKPKYIGILWNADYLNREDSLEKAKLNVILFDDMANKTPEEIEKKIKENDIFRICPNDDEESMHELIQMKEFSIPKMDNGLTEQTFEQIAYKDQFIKFLRNFEDIDIKNVAPQMYEYDEIINSKFKEFPIMVKLKNWYGAERTDNKKYLCAKEKNDITNFFANSEIDPTDYVFSEFIESTTEDSFHFVYSNKRFIRFRQTQKLSDHKFGITHFDGDFHSHHIVSDDNINPDIQEKLQKILEKVNYRGIGCIDVKYRNNDFKNPVFLELNPRICGSMQTLFDDYGDWVRDWALL